MQPLRRSSSDIQIVISRADIYRMRNDIVKILVVLGVSLTLGKMTIDHYQDTTHRAFAASCISQSHQLLDHAVTYSLFHVFEQLSIEAVAGEAKRSPDEFLCPETASHENPSPLLLSNDRDHLYVVCSYQPESHGWTCSNGRTCSLNHPIPE